MLLDLLFLVIQSDMFGQDPAHVWNEHIRKTSFLKARLSRVGGMAELPVGVVQHSQQFLGQVLFFFFSANLKTHTKTHLHTHTHVY